MEEGREIREWRRLQRKFLELFLKNSKSIECKTSWEKIDNVRVIGVQVEPADLLLYMIILGMVMGIIIITMIMVIIMVIMNHDYESNKNLIRKAVWLVVVLVFTGIEGFE